MSDSNIWLEQRHAEIRSMRLEITALEALGDDTAVVRGPGVCSRRRLPGRRPREHRHHPQTGGTVTGSADERRAAALRQAAQAKRQAAVTRTETAIRTLIKSNRTSTSGPSPARRGQPRLPLRQRRPPRAHREAPGPAESPSCPGSGRHADSSDIVHILTEKLRREPTPGEPVSRPTNNSPPPTANYSGSPPPPAARHQHPLTTLRTPS